MDGKASMHRVRPSDAADVDTGAQVIYTTACFEDSDVEPSADAFLPFQVNYTERFSAAGRTR